MKKKNKLKNMQLTSVDVCSQGSNPEAYIRLIKSKDEADDAETGIFDECGYMCGRLYESLCEIIGADADYEERKKLTGKSIDEFSRSIRTAMKAWLKDESAKELLGFDKNKDKAAAESNAEEGHNKTGKENEEAMGKLTREEEILYKKLKAKLGEPDKAAENEEEKDESSKKTANSGGNKSNQPVPIAPKEGEKLKKENIEEKAEKDLPEFAKAILKKSQDFIEKAELKEMTETAKKYEPLGQKAEDLAKQLLELKRKDEAMYNSVMRMLDNQMEMINKSGLFTEIGKSGVQGNCMGAVEKAAGIAEEIRKSSPGMTREQAMAQVWDSHPELMSEYEN